MAVDTGLAKLTVREVLYSLMDVLRRPKDVLAEAQPGPDVLDVNGDPGLFYSVRRTLAHLMLDNERLRAELNEARGVQS